MPPRVNPPFLLKISRVQLRRVTLELDLKSTSNFMLWLNIKRTSKIKQRRTMSLRELNRNVHSSQSFNLKASKENKFNKSNLIYSKISTYRNKSTDSTKPERRRKESRCTPREVLCHPLNSQATL